MSFALLSVSVFTKMFGSVKIAVPFVFGCALLIFWKVPEWNSELDNTRPVRRASRQTQ